MSIQFDFTGKGVFVADGVSELGRSVVEAFHGLGAAVAVHGKSAAEVNGVVRELGGGERLVSAVGDLARIAEVRRIVDTAIGALGRLDVLVCLSTKAGLRALEEIDAEYFERVMGENTKQAFFVTQACVPALRATRGSVVHVASSVGLVGGPRGAVGYATASGATVQMARMMAIELAGDGIRVNSVCSAWVGSSDPAEAAHYGEFMSSRSPLHRCGTPEEVAAAILYLAAPFSAFTTGASLVTDGGLSSGHYVG